MSIFENIIINTIYISFPLLIYLIIDTYNKNLDNNEKNIILELALYSSLFLLIRYGISFKTIYPTLLINIPLLISYQKRKIKTAIIISIILIIFSYYKLHFILIILLIEYILYFITYILKKKSNNFINIFIIIRTLAICYQTCLIMPNKELLEIIYYIFINSFLFACISYTLIYLLQKCENIVDYNSNYNELKREKEIKASLFKITHEVKNPLAVCKGYLDMLESDNKKNYDKYIPIIHNEIKRTLNLMDDFLDYTKINIDKVDTDIYMFLEDIKEEITPLLIKNKIKYNFQIPDDEVYIDIDYNRMKQVFINIFKNSIEARKKDMLIELKTKIKDDHISIYIKDNGIGMSKETLEHIGENFYTTKKNGTGLGVSLSKEIVKLHNGTLEYKSVEKKGTTAIITLLISENNT